MIVKASAIALAYLEGQAKTCSCPERREKFRKMAEDMRAKMGAKS